MPIGRRMMVFVDGENLTMRYQAMLQEGKKPKEQVIHEPDVFVWHPQTIVETTRLEIIRVTYYTYAVGDDVRLEKWANQLKEIKYNFAEGVGQWAGRGFINPKIFKKPQKSAKRKGVDISIAVDALTHVHGNSVDIVYLVSGDGDYMPLIQEIMRSGKQVYLAALSNGLNSILPYSVDKFFNLDNIYFQ